MGVQQLNSDSSKSGHLINALGKLWAYGIGKNETKISVRDKINSNAGHQKLNCESKKNLACFGHVKCNTHLKVILIGTDKSA